MQIDKELLSEKNYTGSRLILIDDENVRALQTELSALQQEINPILDKLSAEYYPKIDPMYQDVLALNEKVKIIKEDIAKITAEFEGDIKSIEDTELKANLVKDKIQPLILDAIKDQLGEFEIARQTKFQDGEVYAEVFDELEEKIKQLRAAKAKQ